MLGMIRSVPAHSALHTICTVLYASAAQPKDGGDLPVRYSLLNYHVRVQQWIAGVSNCPTARPSPNRITCSFNRIADADDLTPISKRLTIDGDPFLLTNTDIHSLLSTVRQSTNLGERVQTGSRDPRRRLSTTHPRASACRKWPGVE